jgi:hypothetical protein
MRTYGASLGIVISLAGVFSILPCPAASAAAESPQDALHEVLPGDNLHLLAGYYYGDARQWERIWQANRDQVRDPNQITRGALLRVPDATPPAEAYVDFVARTHRAQQSAASPAQAETAPGGPSAQPPPAGKP